MKAKCTIAALMVLASLAGPLMAQTTQPAQPAQPPPTAPARSRNGLGVAALVIGVASLVAAISFV